VFIVNFGVTDSNSDSLVKFSACYGVKLINSSWQDATVLKNGGASCHGVRFACSGLAVAEYGAVKAFGCRLNDFAGGCFVSFILGSVMQYFFKRKFPAVSLVIDMAVFRVFLARKIHCSLS